MRRVFVSSVIIFLLILLGTVIAIFYAKGYRLNGTSRVEGTGLLVVSSKPDAAKVFINDNLTTATNNTISLSPGEYTIKITLDGYIPWQKKVIIQKEIVTRADALLFPNGPKLEALTLTGAHHPIVDSTGMLVAFTVASASAEKNGVYVLDMNPRPLLALGGGITQLTDETVDNFSDASLEFSPDSTQLLATITTPFKTTTYLLNSRSFNNNPTDISSTLFVTRAVWEKQELDKHTKRIDSLKKDLRPVVREDFSQVTFSPELDKIMYVASRSAELPLIIKPPLIGPNSTEQVRKIEEGNVYIYDIKEDRNYLLFKKDRIREDQVLPPKYMWHPDSNHIVLVEEKKISVVEYDGTNETTVYSGPFEDHYVFPWSDGLRILILTNLNSTTTPLNLYTVSFK